MQITEAENRKNKLHSGVESINFRPSPNFKHMKKYLKSTPNGNKDSSNSDIQPPLPPNPPPPDSPLQLNLKQEIEDHEYNDLTNSTSEMSTDTNRTEELSKDFQTAQAKGEKGKQRKEIMCRRYIRSDCMKGASCIFAHKIIVSQLNDVYKFCNDFQNSICIRRKCRFVHATVFEKEYFLRTAFLPPHTLRHLKDNDVLQPPPLPLLAPPPLPLPLALQLPPPPPPPPQTEGVTASSTDIVAASLNNHPPLPVLAGVTPPLPMINCAPTASLDARNTVGDIFRAAASDSKSLKRKWADVGDFSSSPGDFCTDSGAKKCKNCDTNEMRLQSIKNEPANQKIRKDTPLDTINQILMTFNNFNAFVASILNSKNAQSTGNVTI